MMHARPNFPMTPARTITGEIAVTANASAEAIEDVVLSILIPFFGDDPTPLMARLNAVIGARKDIEILVLDDGRPDAELNTLVTRTAKAMLAPVRVLTARENGGRSAGRNTLAHSARGRWLLFLDADMAPGSETFLDTYLERIAEDDFDAAFGGYETDANQDERYAVHSALATQSDKIDAEARAAIGATAFCSSNLLVRNRVMRDVPFDTGFVGWGFEDVDWAVRAARVHRLVHMDNPARHGGLQPAEALLGKFREGASNYARLLEKHPYLAGLPGARAARMLSRIPFQKHLRGIWSGMACAPRLPLRLRTAALKLWRASWTAEAI